MTRRGNAGFTLIELIVAITILSLVTLIVGSAFRLGIDAWNRGEAETEATQMLRALSGLLTQQVKSAYPYEMEIDDEKVILFRGDATSILFVTAASEPAFGGFKWVRYSFEDRALLFKEGILPDKEVMDNVSGDEEVIDLDIEEIGFTYLTADGEEWEEEWDFGEELPAGVLVKIGEFQPFFITIPMGFTGEEGFGERDALS